MKKLLLFGLLGTFMITGFSASAQFHASVNINLQPAWGPVGYDYAEYYYLPEVEAYYSVPRQQFVYCDHGRWIYANCLPGAYAGYDLYRGYKVVMNERDPWCHFVDHRMMYAPYRYRHNQAPIGYYRDHGNNGYHGNKGYDNRGYDNRNRNGNGNWGYAGPRDRQDQRGDGRGYDRRSDSDGDRRRW